MDSFNSTSTKNSDSEQFPRISFSQVYELQSAMVKKQAQEKAKKRNKKNWLMDLFKLPKKLKYKTNKSHLSQDVRKALKISRGVTKPKYQISVSRQNTIQREDPNLEPHNVTSTMTSCDFGKTVSRNFNHFDSIDCTRKSIETPQKLTST